MNTIKVPKNLTHLTKNLPKSNYLSTRESKKFEAESNFRMQSEPPNSRLEK